MESLGFNITSLVAQLVNFAVLLVIFRAFLYKPILRMLDSRRERIKEGLDAADRMKEQAARAEQEVQARLAEARQDGQTLIAQAQQMAARLQEEGREQARREGDAMLQRARTEIHLERDAAIAELRQEFADLTIAAAEKVIGQALDRKAHERLIQEVLAEATGKKP